MIVQADSLARLPLAVMLARATCEHLPIAANSVDMIFTDPPYLREYLPCYGWLAREAMRVLKPSGFVLAYTGNLYVNQIYRMFDDAGLKFFLTLVHKSNGDAPIIYVGNNHSGGVPVVVRAKTITAYSKGPGRPYKPNMVNIFETGFASKQYHHWGQSVEEAQYFIWHLSLPGALVLDPFIGGGTTAVACELIGRRCMAFDIDPAALTTTAARLASADILHNLPLFAQRAP